MPASSGDMPQPSSVTRMYSRAAAAQLHASHSARPASTAFSKSSFTAEAGRSTTSPAAMRSATKGESMFIFGMPGTFLPQVPFWHHYNSKGVELSTVKMIKYILTVETVSEEIWLTRELRSPPKSWQRQREICAKIREGLGGARPLAFVDTYGCQQNEADSEALRGYIELMGFGFTEDENEAELIVVNTCAVRGHAEMRVLGNVGALVHAKAQQPAAHRRGLRLHGPAAAHGGEDQKVLPRSGPRASARTSSGAFPSSTSARRGGAAGSSRSRPARASSRRACPCTGRAASRPGSPSCTAATTSAPTASSPTSGAGSAPGGLDDVVGEARSLVEAGYKDITLLGQNVNSYGKDLDEGRDFADLIREINDIPGDFLIRFMTSHPRGRHGKALPHHGRVRKVRKAHPPARPVRQQPGAPRP